MTIRAHKHDLPTALEMIRESANQRIYEFLGKESLPLVAVHGKEIVFIHIDRTAGISMVKSLNIKYNIHLSVKDIISKMGQERWDKAFSFSFVRNPWDKVVSLYTYQLGDGTIKDNFGYVTFRDWVLMGYRDKSDYFFDREHAKLFRQQLDWLKNDKGVVDVDFIGRFENLHTDFHNLCNLLGIQRSLPHLNKSKKEKDSYRDYYDLETKSVVQAFFKDDIGYFGYEF